MENTETSDASNDTSYIFRSTRTLGLVSKSWGRYGMPRRSSQELGYCVGKRGWRTPRCLTRIYTNVRIGVKVVGKIWSATTEQPGKPDGKLGCRMQKCMTQDTETRITTHRIFPEHLAKDEREEVQKLHDADEAEADEDAAYTADIACKTTNLYGATFR